MQEPCASTVQVAKPSAWQSIWQLKLASAVHEPLQLASHLASQSAEGGVPSQLASQWPEQVAWQEARHSAPASPDSHEPSQSASQPAWHRALQSYEPGSTSQAAWQSVSHEPVHSTIAVALHSPAQLT